MYTGVSMNIEGHRRAVRESLEEIKEAVQKGVMERQRTIGFHCSVAAADMLEIFLHEQNLIDPGTTIKHEFFASVRKAEERLPMDFPEKGEVIGMLVELEARRNALCYGKPQAREAIEQYLLAFNRIRKIFDKLGVRYE
jgi:hypothetical protein